MNCLCGKPFRQSQAGLKHVGVHVYLRVTLLLIQQTDLAKQLLEWPSHGSHVFMLRWHRDCSGNAARMATAGFPRQKPRTVTSEEELGPWPSAGTFTVTPSWLVPFPRSVSSNGR